MKTTSLPNLTEENYYKIMTNMTSVSPIPTFDSRLHATPNGRGPDPQPQGRSRRASVCVAEHMVLFTL